MAIKLDERSKTYTVSYSKRHPVTRRPYSLRRTKVKTKAEAKRVYSELVVLVHEKLKESVMPNWKRLVDEYSMYLFDSDVSTKTAESYSYGLRAHTKDWNERFIDSINGSEIRTIIKEKVGDKSQSHQKNVLKYIRSAFNFAREKGYINYNPSPAMKFKIGRKLEEVLTEPQVEMFLNQAKLMDVEWYPIWCTALYTGMRNGELYALTWDKVNFDTNKIMVNCSWNNKDGYKGTKSGDDRIVDIAPNLLHILKELKVRNQNPPHVLPRIDKWDKGRQAEDLRMFLTGLGLPSIRFHDLRATWATVLLSKGVPPIKVMRMGGWKEMSTMERYTRLAGVDVDGIAEKLDLHNPSLPAGDVIHFSK
jgi:integrase